MVRIQLQTGEYLNVAEGTAFPMTYSIGDIRDVSKKTGSKSKTITLVGDDNNNNLLGHYYDVNIEAGTFNVNTITRCRVIEDDNTIMSDAYLQLIEIDKIEHSHQEEQEIRYSALIKDATADFYTEMDNKELTDIDLTDLNHTYSAAKVVASFTNDYTDGYMYPLGLTPTADTVLTDYAPAIYLRTLWDRIHSTNGFSSTVNVDIFDKLVIPYNGETPKANYQSYEVNANKTSFIITEANYNTTITS